MSKFLFLMSHIGSGSSRLFDSLSNSDSIHGFRTEIVYDSPESLQHLQNNFHKNDNKASVWMDELLHNFRLTCKPLCKTCQLVFLFGDPHESIEEIAKTYPSYEALNYYRFRLQGMLEYIARTPGCLIFTWDRIEFEGLQSLERALMIRAPLTAPTRPKSTEKRLSLDVYKEAELIYDRLCFKLKALEKRC